MRTLISHPNMNLKPVSLHISLLVMLLTCMVVGSAPAQDVYGADRILTLLRGSWESKSFYDKWTLVFEDDRRMIFDQDEVTYTLGNGIIRVKNDDATTEYPYRLDADRLILKLPDGTERTYSREGPGDAEQLLTGAFQTPGSLKAQGTFEFDGNNTFHLRTSRGEGTGNYRIVGNSVVLSWDDTTSEEAKIQTRDQESNLITAITYHDASFLTTTPPQQSDEAIVPNYTTEPSQPAYSVQNPPPPPVIISEPVLPAASARAAPAKSANPPEAEKKKTRDAGTTRENKPGGR